MKTVLAEWWKLIRTILVRQGSGTGPCSVISPVAPERRQFSGSDLGGVSSSIPAASDKLQVTLAPSWMKPSHFHPVFPPPASPLPKSIILTATSYFPKIKSRQIMPCSAYSEGSVWRILSRLTDEDCFRWPQLPFRLGLPHSPCRTGPAPCMYISFHIKCPSLLIGYLLKSNNLSGPSSTIPILSHNSIWGLPWWSSG